MAVFSNSKIAYNPFRKMGDINLFSKQLSYAVKSINPPNNLHDNMSIEMLLLKENPITKEPSDFNSLGFRSEEFSNTHLGEHILFAGCSETFGVGLSLTETWSYKLFKKISELRETSGYYNLSDGGIGFATIIPNIFKYCLDYGNPSTIFVNLPNVLRFYTFIDGVYHYDSSIERSLGLAFRDTDSRQAEFHKYYILYYQYYLMLEAFCVTNKINLFSFSWDINSHDQKEKVLCTQDIFKEFGFDTFYQVDKDKLYLYVEEWIKNNKDYEDLAITARDNQHSGIAINDFWSEMMFKSYIDRTSK